MQFNTSVLDIDQGSNGVAELALVFLSFVSQLWVEGSFPHADENGSSHSPKGENEPSFQSYSQESRDSL